MKTLKKVKLPADKVTIPRRLMTCALSMLYPGLGQMLVRGDRQWGFTLMMMFSFSMVLIITIPFAVLVWCIAVGNGLEAHTFEVVEISDSKADTKKAA